MEKKTIIQTIEDARGWIISENDDKIVLGNNKDAADWISQEIMDAGGNGAIYGAFEDSKGNITWEVYKCFMKNFDVTIQLVLRYLGAEEDNAPVLQDVNVTVQASTSTKAKEIAKNNLKSDLPIHHISAIEC